ncbi:uncharacterized protein KY384_003770 [Bacidia gigantensis]|uniref:uncharacterized protein n=1 Tax=Bacidia gigantensis TaxID=2732470 RepID=UPI001D0512D6|nr:uncharacterized protein KY384_003770 [Bacidia gigantensis]KAG8532131.1 hypothetical protein KY384_003770 [Bacidia gigantensis]
MGTNMKRLVEEHANEIAQNPRIDIEKVRKIRYLYEFDRELQGPTWGYPTEGAYYRDASSCDSLLSVRTPLFGLHAEDDPIAVAEALPLQEIKQNPWTVLCTTSRGGHLGWFESGGDRWFTKPACRFLQRMSEGVDFEKLSSRSHAEDGVQEPNGSPGVFDPMRRKLEALKQSRTDLE